MEIVVRGIALQAQIIKRILFNNLNVSSLCFIESLIITQTGQGRSFSGRCTWKLSRNSRSSMNEARELKEIAESWKSSFPLRGGGVGLVRCRSLGIESQTF